MLALYHFWDSVCSFKVRFCLSEKGLAWEGHHVDLMRFENLEPGFLEINGKGIVPVLVHDGAVIAESTTINEYLDDRYPEHKLRPEDPLARARMRNWVKLEEDELFSAIRPVSLNLMMKQIYAAYTDEDLDRFLRHHPRQDRIGFLKQMFKAPVDTKAVESGRKRLAAALRAMDRQLAEDGPWLAGRDFSLADIAAAPIVDRIQALGMASLWDDLPDAADWVERLTARPAYQAAAPPDDQRLPAPVQA